jgi:hypothetical protein
MNTMFWKGHDVYLTSTKARGSYRRAWKLAARSAVLQPVPSDRAVDPVVEAKILRSKLRQKIRLQDESLAHVQLDVWCQNCGLENLPRQTSG